MYDFVRTAYGNQFYGSLFSNAIEYDQFCNGFYITGFDLTATGKREPKIVYFLQCNYLFNTLLFCFTGSGGNLPFTTPMVRKGKIRLLS